MLITTYIVKMPFSRKVEARGVAEKVQHKLYSKAWGLSFV